LLLAILLREIIREIFIFVSIVIMAMGRGGVRKVLAFFFKPIQGCLHLLLALSRIGSRILTVREEGELLIV
jgi:hypothetical protein